MRKFQHLILRLLACSCAVAITTVVAFRVIPVNATTVGFAYLLIVLAVASTWGFLEASFTSVVATLCYNFFFLDPILTFTIEDPQNWVALFTFLVTALVASRLSDWATRQTTEAVERRRDVERLYSFSRALLLIGRDEPFPRQLTAKLTELFEFNAAVLYDRRTGEFFRAGPSDFEGLDDQLRDAAMHGTSFSGEQAGRIITAIRLGGEPIASLALQGAHMPDSVLQGIANLVAIGLERAKAQDLSQEVEAARQSEQLRTTLIDAMAHEFKTPLTLIKGATSSVLADPDRLTETAREQLVIADEEATHLEELLDTSIEMARLDTARIEIHPEISKIAGIVEELVASMRTVIEDRRLDVAVDPDEPSVPVDRRLIKLALKQLVDNALKYSPPGSPFSVHVRKSERALIIEITDHGPGIPPEDQKRIFDRFFRGSTVRNRIPGSGLGLNIAASIVRAHGGDLTVASRPGETAFRMTLPMEASAGGHS